MKYIGNVQSQANAEVFAVASGALPDGKPVIVNSNGTVSVVGETAVSQASGTPVVFEDSGTTEQISVAYDSSNSKVIVAYADSGNSSFGKAVVGTLNAEDNSISFGTPEVFHSSASFQISAVYDVNAGKTVIAWQDFSNSGVGKAIVGTVSGTSISFGTAVTFRNAITNYQSITYDSNSNKVVIGYRDSGNSHKGTAIVGTVSGTSISFGTAVEFEQGATVDVVMTFDSNSNKVVIVYRDDGDSSKPKAIVGTVSGTGISFGTAVQIFGADGLFVSAGFDSDNNKIIATYMDSSDSNKGKAIVGTVSGTSISFGTAVTFESGNQAGNTFTSYDENAKKITIAYRDESNSGHGTIIAGTVSGTTISFDNPHIFENASVNEISTVYDSSSKKIVIAYRDVGNGNDGTSSIFQPAFTSTNITTENFLGFTGGEVVPENVGSPVNFESGSTSYVANTYDSNADRVVVAYSDAGDSGKGKVAVGTVSGDSTSFGTPVAFTDYQMQETRVVFDSNSNKIVIAWIKSSDNAGLAIVGTVDPSDNSISFGSEVQYESLLGHMSLGFDSTNNKVISAFADVSDNNHGYAIVGTVSGTSISFGSIAKFEAENTRHTDIAHDPDTGKTVIAYVDQGNSSYGTAVVSTVSGSSISFGTPVVYESASVENNSVVYDTNSNKMVIAYGDIGNSQNGTAVVGTVSGTSISFGTPVVFDTTGYILQPICTFDAGSNKVIITFSQNNQGNDGRYIVGTVSGTSISFSSSNLIGTGTRFSDQSFWIANVGSNKNSIVYRANLNSDVGRAVVLTLEQRPEIADGKTATIQVGGSINTQQNALTAGQQYFVQADGTIDLTAASPSVIAGTAVSATDLIVKG